MDLIHTDADHDDPGKTIREAETPHNFQQDSFLMKQQSKNAESG
jgi:hypothetical protein